MEEPPSGGSISQSENVSGVSVTIKNHDDSEVCEKFSGPFWTNIFRVSERKCPKTHGFCFSACTVLAAILNMNIFRGKQNKENIISKSEQNIAHS